MRDKPWTVKIEPRPLSGRNSGIFATALEIIGWTCLFTALYLAVAYWFTQDIPSVDTCRHIVIAGQGGQPDAYAITCGGRFD